MNTSAPYSSIPKGVSDISDATLRVRSALVARGTSLRAWAHAFAARTGRPKRAVYSSARMALERWGNRTDRAPEGALAREIMDALRAELGADVVHPFGPEAQRVSPKRKRSRRGHADAA